jgi:hypothetical protein
VQAKRVKVEALTTYRDAVSNRHLGNLADLIEQANGSREFGFHLNYAMIVVQIDGPQRSEFNFLARTTTPEHFSRIYHRAWDSPLHEDVGNDFCRDFAPTGASVDNSGFIAIPVDKR